MTDQIWFEDFTPGAALISPRRRITISDIDTYAALTGERHPVHMDEAFAREAGFDGRIAHGLFSLALIEGLKSQLGVFERSVTASLGWTDIKFSAPLYPGEEVYLRLEFVDKRMTSKPGRGLATERGFLLKADGTEVVSGDHLIFLLCRPGDEAAR
ncbi:MaoC family dehydratase [Pseudodonghicola flavimaris]|uniref:MaoC/PaaZ C-terminal domain-containing protein n=1 Tax=Pseudodonghicola flavimaris TaxID=3050036 RepID=A0ABT7EY97_9RHOB|nr:MaoC/PaaZ C-terminal domain-containing protein [Pseudodonghicola flavimaris]MDK3017313.1 MaoC/PaaZ C-terminal domain-containing protein [Pseudodonghicola flavimaris]